MGYFQRVTTALLTKDEPDEREPQQLPLTLRLEPRRPVHWAELELGAARLTDRIVQIGPTTWAVPSGANRMYGYVVTGPRQRPAHLQDVDDYVCTCPWGRPQGAEGRPGVGCRHVLAVIRRRMGLVAQRAA